MQTCAAISSTLAWVAHWSCWDLPRGKETNVPAAKILSQDALFSMDLTSTDSDTCLQAPWYQAEHSSDRAWRFFWSLDRLHMSVAGSPAFKIELRANFQLLSNRNLTLNTSGRVSERHRCKWSLERPLAGYPGTRSVQASKSLWSTGHSGHLQRLLRGNWAFKKRKEEKNLHVSVNAEASQQLAHPAPFPRGMGMNIPFPCGAWLQAFPWLPGCRRMQR